VNVELYKILESSKINNYDQSDMGEPGTLYIPPMEVPKNGPGNLWGTKTSSTFGGGPHRQSGKARYGYSIERPKALAHPWDAKPNSIFRFMDPSQEGNSNGAQTETNSTPQADRRTRTGSDEDARQEFPVDNSNSNPGRNTETHQNSEPGNGGLIRMIIHEHDAFAFLNDDSI